ncbi:hypothetical protein [Candidatus Nitrospira nitrificans]|uniref:hypothetical protein n=1 Tax=Candidatus Nitrospira nitrificans TaxID=1742973 RepID=UPI0015857C46|nr:hypothetical protein [Candidatus Nitrospira nitrificans]
MKKSSSFVPRLAEAASRGVRAYLVKRTDAAALAGEMRVLAIGFAAPGADSGALGVGR